MKIIKSDLNSAVEKGILSTGQSDQLWNHLESLRPEQPHFHALHVLYYFGGILVLSAMSWFLTTAWEDGAAVMITSGLFALAYFMAGKSLWSNEAYQIPGGLLITAAVGLTPVFIYGLQKVTGLWPIETPENYQNYHYLIKGSWFFMEIGTILAASVAIKYFRFPFITFPMALALWYMSMDLTPFLFGKKEFTYFEMQLVSCIFGFALFLVSYFFDLKKTKVDYSFWTYLFGMLAFWGGLSLMDSTSEFNKFIYCLINVCFIFISVYLRRKVFIIFGTIGVFGYIGHLAWRVFKDSYAFPIVVAFLGIVILFLATQYQKNRNKIEATVLSYFPAFLTKWRPPERI